MADEMSHAPIDPGLVMPDAVRAGAARADALIRGLNGSTTLADPNSPANPQNLPGGRNLEQMPPSLDSQSSTHPTPQSFQLNGQTPVPPQGGAQPVPPDDGQSQNYEAMYRSLKGRWDNEMPRLRDTVQQLAQRSNQLETLLGTMQTQTPGGAVNGNGGGGDPLGEFTPEEREQWGDDMLQMFARVVERRTQQAAQRSMQPFVEQSRQQRQQGVEVYLDREVPQWREINFMPEFMDWSILSDPFSGAIRRDLLNRAFEEGNGHRVAHFFRSFLSEVSAAPATQRSQPQPAPAPPAPQAGPQPQASQRISMAELAAPSGAGATAGPPPAPAAKRVYRRSEITQFYSDKALGRYNTPDLQAQASAVEQDLFLAQREGRVVNG